MILSEKTQNFLDQHSHQKLVFTNGCFDLLHKGHVTYLNEAKKLGDVLLIGLNSDESVRQLKGEKRPILKEGERKFLLENLKAVDCVEIFHQRTPVELIKSVRPDVFVKGGDYEMEKIPEYPVLQELGARIEKLSFVEGSSTTQIIQSILDLERD